MGAIHVPHDRYRGAQTARSLLHFDIGDDVKPPELIRAPGNLKRPARWRIATLANLPLMDKAHLSTGGGRG